MADDSLQTDAAARIDPICRQFEAAWQRGERPKIEEFLWRAEANDGAALFAELLHIELHYRRTLGDQLALNEYRARFPDRASEVETVFSAAEPESPNQAAECPPAAAKSSADRNLLFGILAVQMDFISGEALVAAMNAWVLRKSTPIGELLVEQKALSLGRRTLLEALVNEHLKQHDNRTEKSLAAASSSDSVWEELSLLGDRDLEASLAHASATRAHKSVASTQTRRAGEATSARTRFRVLRPHARGGIGEVYLAHDEELHREVALKEIQERHAHDPNSRSRFLLEAEITGSLEHPGIVPVYALGTYADGRPFYAMRFIQGDNLKEAIERFHSVERLRRKRATRGGFSSLEFRKLLGRFIDVCNAIEYAHSRGVLHRDLKPGNIMLGKYGETLVVDWGLAKVIGRPGQHAPGDDQTLQPSSAHGFVETQVGSVIGTPEYMSPEQAEGRLDDLGPASDIYSLGATLYTILTGQSPFHDIDRENLLPLIAKGTFAPPRKVNESIPRGLAAICQKAMARSPQERYNSALAMANDCESWLADRRVAALGETAAQLSARWRRSQEIMLTLDSRECEFVRSLARSKCMTDANLIREWVREKLNEQREST